ncbi:MAG: VIT domain-containing protein [Planctomycetota bacterium]
MTKRANQPSRRAWQTLCWVFCAIAASAVWMGCNTYISDGRKTPQSAPPGAHYLGGLGLLAQRANSVDARAVMPAEELWIIIPEPTGQQRSDAEPPAGSLLALTSGHVEVAVPLRHTDVAASIKGGISAVTVAQSFHNPYDTKIEAKYVFPLPHEGAVTDFVMVIGERRIRGLIRERELAEQIYSAAKHQGHVAALMTQERPNIFTQSVANIEPGKSIDVEITYFHTLPLVDGEFEFVFPMVVAPRFNPPHVGGNGIGATPRGQAGTSGQRVEVGYLGLRERSGHDISIAVTIEAGLPVREVRSTTHAIEREQPDSGLVRVQLRPGDKIPNRDFVLRYRVASETVQPEFVCTRDDSGGYFQLTLHPPHNLHVVPRQPMEFIFVVDASGSMKGRPLELAKGAILRSLSHLDVHDTFQIIRFSNEALPLTPAPVPATVSNVERARRYLDEMSSAGGTHMIHGVRAALAGSDDPERQRLVSFMTDGFIGNESEIFRAVLQHVGDARLFSFGVGSSVNRHLLAGMARLGRGAVAYVGLDEGVANAVDRFYERVARPALTDIAIDWGTLGVSEQVGGAGDVFYGRPATVLGRFSGTEPTTIRVRGRQNGEWMECTVACDPTRASQHQAVSQLWARKRIQALTDGFLRRYDPADGAAVRRLALEHNLLSAYTAFVAVDASQVTAGREGVTVGVPVPVPAGMRYETSTARPGG